MSPTTLHSTGFHDEFHSIYDSYDLRSFIVRGFLEKSFGTKDSKNVLRH